MCGRSLRNGHAEFRFPLHSIRRNALAVGCTALALAIPPVLPAQQRPVSDAASRPDVSPLPDAPSAVMERHSDSAATPDTAAFRQWQLALNAEPAAVEQQSLYQPGRPRPTSGYSSSISETRPVPGAGPVLHNACPNNSCSQAQSFMCCGTAPSPFVRYLKSPDAVPLTARDNLHSAVKGVIDPFNLMTIAADAAIGVASDSHSVYGPGFDGFSKYAGVSLTEDMTGEFFGTFAIPSIMHQDPHYHREPYVSIKRRILHAVTQVVWAQSYTGQPMFNYGNIVGGIATAAVSNTFVPGPGRQGFGATAQRLAIAFAISPSGNLIEEFVPDIASRINLRVVIFQRILNTVSLEESGVP